MNNSRLNTLDQQQKVWSKKLREILVWISWGIESRFVVVALPWGGGCPGGFHGRKFLSDPVPPPLRLRLRKIDRVEGQFPTKRLAIPKTNRDGRAHFDFFFFFFEIFFFFPYIFFFVLYLFVVDSFFTWHRSFLNGAFPRQLWSSSLVSPTYENEFYMRNNAFSIFNIYIYIYDTLLA